MNIRLSAIDARIIGALIEKQITTPDQYPLSLNALVNACNQKSNREPLMQLDEPTVKFVGRRPRDAATSSWRSPDSAAACRSISRSSATPNSAASSSRRRKPRIVCELLLRGPQTPGELRARVPRMAELPDPGVIESLLAGLANRPDGAHRRATAARSRPARLALGTVVRRTAGSPPSWRAPMRLCGRQCNRRRTPRAPSNASWPHASRRSKAKWRPCAPNSPHSSRVAVA